MRIRRSFPLALVIVSIAAAVIVAVQLRKSAPPEPARLLPGADGFLYANYGWIRKVTTLPPVSHDPDYQQFIQETGVEFERDLDSVALAIHYPANWPGGGTGGNAPEPRFSEVFSGKFDGALMAAYLKKVARSVDEYESVNIYTIPIAGRSFRVAILSVDSIAASNHDDPSVIRGIVDRSRRLASPFGGPALLRRYYKHVQLASPVWVVAHVQPQSPAFGAVSDLFSKPADLVLSASYSPFHLPLRSGVLHLQAEAWTDSNDDAHAVADRLGTFLTMFHSAELSVGTGTSDADVKAMLDSLRVHQEGKAAVLYCMIPVAIFKKLMESGQPIPAAVVPSR